MAAWPCPGCDPPSPAAQRVTFIPPVATYPTMSSKWTEPTADGTGCLPALGGESPMSG